MSGQDSAQEKTEQATPKRREDARKKGQVTRSRELTTMLLLMVAAAMLMGTGDDLVGGVADVMRKGLVIDHRQAFDPNYMKQALRGAIIDALLVLAPLLIVAFITASVAPLLLGGWNVKTPFLKFDAGKLSPLKGVKRIFSLNSVVELLKALGKFFIVLSIAMIIIWQSAGDVMQLGLITGLQGIYQSGDILTRSFLFISAATIVIAAVDVPYQIWDGSRKLKMSFQEVKEESKNTDGNPEIKRRVKEVQQEISGRRMMEEVPKADVIIVNPRHYAVALKYDSKGSSAPQLIASGGDLMALKIRTLAAEHKIPVVRAPALARSIYHFTCIGDEIPEGLFVAVAQVLAFIYQLKSVPRKVTREYQMNDLPIPEELRFDP